MDRPAFPENCADSDVLVDGLAGPGSSRTCSGSAWRERYGAELAIAMNPCGEGTERLLDRPSRPGRRTAGGPPLSVAAAGCDASFSPGKPRRSLAKQDQPTAASQPLAQQTHLRRIHCS